MKLHFFIIALLMSFKSYSIENGMIATKPQLIELGIVAIIFEEDGREKSVCTGTRISPNVVITAWHCVNSFENFPIGVRQSLEPLDTHYNLEKIAKITFPGLTDDFFNDYLFKSFFGSKHDIAILILEESTLNPFLSISSKLEINSFIQLGYGMDSHEDTKDSYPLSYLDNGIISPVSTNLMINILNEQSSLRDGDSGGPLIIKNGSEYQVVGILSDANPSPLEEIINGSSNYTDLKYFSDWLSSFTKIHVPTSEVTQYNREKNIFLTKKNIRKTYAQLCKNLSQKYGSHWSFNSDMDCMPGEESTCEEVSGPIFPVKWDSELKKCTYL
jgi:hypothetical protein